MLTPQDISSSTQLRKSDAMSCSSRLATYKESVVITTRMFNDALSVLEIWFFEESRMIPDYASLTHDGKGFSSCTRSQALCHITYSTLMARAFLIPGILSIYIIFILNQPRHLLTVPGDQYFQYTSILLVYDWYYTQV
jgi:hypothetical protein